MTDHLLASCLITTVASLIGREGREPALTTAALLQAADPAPLARPALPCDDDTAIRAVFAQTPLPTSAHILSAQALIPWGSNPVAQRLAPHERPPYCVATLLGPDGPLPCATHRAGFFFQRPNTYYGLHRHNAAETYTIIAGSALWTAGGSTQMRHAGDAIHHPSLMPHAFRAGPSGFVAIWRWDGDIAIDSYEMLPDPLSA